MMCEMCGKRPASIHLTTISDGGSSEKALCAECFNSLRQNNPEMGAGLLAAALRKVFSEAEKAIESESTEPYKNMACPGCGRKYSDFKKTKRLGCEECYNTFGEPIEEYLIKNFGSAGYTGRASIGSNKNVKDILEVDSLKRKMQLAIKNEDYEEAARLRDRIKLVNAEAGHAV